MYYEITVWDITDGSIIRKAWRVDQDERDEIFEMYGDEPAYEIIVDDEWESND